MIKKICIVKDISGSMTVLSKTLIAENGIKTLKQLKDFDYRYKAEEYELEEKKWDGSICGNSFDTDADAFVYFTDFSSAANIRTKGNLLKKKAVVLCGADSVSEEIKKHLQEYEDSDTRFFKAVNVIAAFDYAYGI